MSEVKEKTSHFSQLQSTVVSESLREHSPFYSFLHLFKCLCDIKKACCSLARLSHITGPRGRRADKLFLGPRSAEFKRAQSPAAGIVQKNVP